MSNICTRCGNERIASKTWKEVTELYGRKMTITHQEFVCKDSECQKIVENQLRVQKEKRESYERQKDAKKAALKTPIAARNL